MSSLTRRVRKSSAWVRHDIADRSARTSPVVPGHRFIDIGRYHRNLKNAEEYVLRLFQQRDPSAYLPKVREQVLREGEGKNRFEVSFRAAVQEARETGTAESLWSYLNGGDPYFTFTMGIAGGAEGASMKVGFAGQELTLAAPMRQMSIETELTQDILDHRRIASEFSIQEHDHYRTTAMHYRSYLLSACALVEAFLNRCVLLELHKGRRSTVLDELQRPCSVERRFELWLQEFAGEPLSAINSGVEWDHFQELRRNRNSLMHATQSMLGIGLKDAARQLNLVRHGGGGLVNLLRKTQGLPPVHFAERLETAPQTQFCSEQGRGQAERRDQPSEESSNELPSEDKG